VVENNEVEVPFIGLERGLLNSRSEELDGGRGVRFEVTRFEDEGDTVRRRFIGQKEGGRAALRFRLPARGGGHGKRQRTAWQRQLGGWWRLGRPREGDDAGGGPSWKT
jgi:hypothetical protein